MADISLVHVVDGTPNAAAGINDNLDIIQTEINGLLNEDNLPSLPEANVVFSGSAGHRHGGGTDGRTLVAAAMPTVIPGTAKGVVNAVRGVTGSIAAGGGFEEIDLSLLDISSVARILSVQVVINDVADFINAAYEGSALFAVSIPPNRFRGYYWDYSETTGIFRIHNRDTDTAHVYRYCILYSDA